MHVKMMATGEIRYVTRWLEISFLSELKILDNEERIEALKKLEKNSISACQS